MQYLGIGFLVLLFLEIMSIVWVADWLGGGVTLLLMLASFIIGLFMLRRTGLSGLLLAGAAIRSGTEISLYQMLWPIRFTLAAVLLMSPGFISMAIALILLLPIKGKPIANIRSYTFNPNQQSSHQNPFASSHATERDDDIIDAEYTVTRTHSPQPTKQDYIEHKPD